MKNLELENYGVPNLTELRLDECKKIEGGNLFGAIIGLIIGGLIGGPVGVVLGGIIVHNLEDWFNNEG